MAPRMNYTLKTTKTSEHFMKVKLKMIMQILILYEVLFKYYVLEAIFKDGTTLTTKSIIFPCGNLMIDLAS